MQNLEWYLADLKSTGKNTIETVEKSLTDMFIRLVRIYPCLRGTRRCCGVETLIQRRNNAVCQVGRLNKEEKSMKRPVCQPVIDVRWPSLARVSVCVSVRRAYLAICSGCEEEITT